MNRGKEYQSVVLASLLHDIGEFLQHDSSIDFISKNIDLFSEAADPILLANLTQHCHEPEGVTREKLGDKVELLICLLRKADFLSSAEHGEPEGDSHTINGVGLASVLERVNRVGEEDYLKFRYPVKVLGSVASLDVIFPDNSQGVDTYQKHLEVFKREFEDLFRDKSGAVDRGNFDCLVSHILNILYRYTWCVPTHSLKFPDVSLFDHLRNTTAVASCLYVYHSDKNDLNNACIDSSEHDRFLLVTGDVSGIQNYIFDISSIGVGGVARRLRARSLFVQICSEVASHLVLRRLDLPIPVHTIMNSGGRFYLLLPNLPEVKRTITQVQTDLDRWLFKELNGELAVNLASVSFGDSGFSTTTGGAGGFGSVLETLSDTLRNKKLNRFGNVLCSSNHWEEDEFKLDVSFEGGKACQSCHKFPQTEGEVCKHCKLDNDIGARLPDTRYFAFFDSSPGQIPVFGYSVSLFQSLSEIKGDPYLILRLNDTNLKELAQYPAQAKFLAKHLAEADKCEVCQKDESRVATFECLAQRRFNGDKLLGFLKADVDNLGRTFIFGLKGEKFSVDTMSRISTMSRMLDTFFSGWVEHLTEGERDFYTVYSGGDDLFIIGPWDKILGLAEKINADFHRLTSNATLSLSAGIVMAKHSYPISSAAESADDALDKAKKSGRNSVHVLGSTLKWEDWVRVNNEYQELRPIADNIPTTFLYRLLHFSDMWRQYTKYRRGEDGGDINGLRYHPLLAYAIARNIDSRKAPQLRQWAEKILQIFPGDKEKEFSLDNLGLVARLLIMTKRGGGD